MLQEFNHKETILICICLVNFVNLVFIFKDNKKKANNYQLINILTKSKQFLTILKLKIM
jgi:hypothetical protein